MDTKKLEQDRQQSAAVVNSLLSSSRPHIETIESVVYGNHVQDWTNLQLDQLEDEWWRNRARLTDMENGWIDFRQLYQLRKESARHRLAPMQSFWPKLSSLPPAPAVTELRLQILRAMVSVDGEEITDLYRYIRDNDGIQCARRAWLIKAGSLGQSIEQWWYGPPSRSQ